MLETYYLDGPMVYATHSLRYLIKQRQKVTWFGLQHVIRFTRVNNIEDYELLLYVIMTDHVDIRVRNDSFGGQLKFFMTYSDVVQFSNQLTMIADSIVRTLQAGSNTKVFSIPVNTYLFKFSGAFDPTGNTYITLEIEKVHATKGVTKISVSKFVELVAAFDSIRRNWHNTLTTTMYQMDRFGKAFNSLQREVVSLKQELTELKQMLKTLIESGVHIKQEEPRNLTQPTMNEIQVAKVTSEEPQPQIKKTFSLNTFINNTSTNTQNNDTPKQESTKQTPVSDFVLGKLDSIIQKDNKPKQAEANTQSNDGLVDKLPLNVITHVELLKPYIVDNDDIYSFVRDNQDQLFRIFVGSGVPEGMIRGLPKLVEAVYALKDIFNDRPVNSMIGHILYDIVKGGQIDTAQLSTG